MTDDHQSGDPRPVIQCPCGIGRLRVYRVTVRPGEIQRERRCERGHRVITFEVFVGFRRQIEPKLLPVAKPEG